MPKPVTSVMACTPFIFPSAAPTLFKVVNCFTNKSRSADSINPFFCAVAKIPTPNGLVNNKISPCSALLFLFKFSIATMPFTTKPKMGSLLSILCPPAITMPASAHTDLAPAITSCAADTGIVSIGQPSTAKANSGFPPIAYTSLIAFAAAICPN